MTPPPKKDRESRSWTVVIGKGQHKGRGMRFEIWLAEIEGRPVSIRIMGGGPLQHIIADLCEAITLGLAAGVPVAKYVQVYRGRRDEISGPVTGDPHGVTECGGIMDYISQALGARYCNEGP